jgi:hypothetical protein
MMLVWRRLMRPLDWLTLAVCAVLTGLSFDLFWSADRAQRAVIRRDGQVIAQFPLTAARDLAIDGPLGQTRIEIAPGRARVVTDPGPRQYCVRQGWLSTTGAVAICAPNHISLSLEGGAGQTAYDSLGY